MNGSGKSNFIEAIGFLRVELKAVEHLAPIHMAQLLSYLKAMKIRHGLLVMFNVPALRLGSASSASSTTHSVLFSPLCALCASVVQSFS
ncbi:GxxExxY protein [Sorangium sp. So ce1128]